MSGEEKMFTEKIDYKLIKLNSKQIKTLALASTLTFTKRLRDFTYEEEQILKKAIIIMEEQRKKYREVKIK